MSPFWASFLQHLKHCGKNATLFLFVLPLIMIAAVLATRLPVEWLWYFLGVCAVCALVAAIRMIIARVNRQPLKFRPLSTDELRVARQKLSKKAR